MAIKDLRVNLSPKILTMKTGSRRDILSKTLEGSFITPFKGKGMEFAGFRAYGYGDDASTIDWPASLRAKELLVKDFEVYKNINILFVLDVSDSMLFSSTKKNKLKVEYAAELVAAMAYALVNTNNSIGLVLANDKIVDKVYPNIGQGVVSKFRHVLSNPKNYGGKSDFKRVVHLIKSFFPLKALVFWVSDFINMQEGWSQYVQMMQKDYETVAIVVRDPRDLEFPNMTGQFLLEDPYSNEVVQVDVKQYKKLYKEQTDKELKQVRKVFDKYHYLMLRTDQDYNDTLTRYFKKRNTMFKT